MAVIEQIFDELFSQTLDCVTELRQRQIDADLALEAANKKVAYYEALLAETPGGLERRNAELAAKLEESQKEVADLRKVLQLVLANYHTAAQQFADALAAIREVSDGQEIAS